MKMKNIAIFASGTGTNTRNIITYFKNNSEINVSVVLSGSKNAGVVQIAKEAGIPCVITSKDEFNKGKNIAQKLKFFNIDFIVLAGFLWLLPSYLVKKYYNRIVNIHPALLPKYGGKGMYGNNVHQAVIEAKEKQSGISIHYVNERYDEGNIIFQSSCPVLPGDTLEDLAARVHKLEYEHYPKVIERLLIEMDGT